LLKRDKRGFLRSEASDVPEVLTAGDTEVSKNGGLELEAGRSPFHEILPKILILSPKSKTITGSQVTHILCAVRKI
jgi:hypothetical protein